MNKKRKPFAAELSVKTVFALLISSPTLFLASCNGGAEDDSGEGSNLVPTGINIPPAWIGLWRVTQTRSSTEGVIPAHLDNFPQHKVESYCGEVKPEDFFIVPPELPGITLYSSGYWNDFFFTLTYSGQKSGGTCNVRWSQSYDLMRTSTGFFGTHTVSLDPDPACDEEPYSQTIDMEGEFLDPLANQCDSSLQKTVPASWNGVWTDSSDTPLVYLCAGNSVASQLGDGTDQVSLGYAIESPFESSLHHIGASIIDSNTAFPNCVAAQVLRIELSKTPGGNGAVFSGSGSYHVISGVCPPDGAGVVSLFRTEPDYCQ